MKNRTTRKPLRLPEYNYNGSGTYFVTICTQNRSCILSDIIVGDGVLDVPQVQLSKYGHTVEQMLEEIQLHYCHINIEKYVIMPNHIHFLLHISENGTSRTPSPTNAALPQFISTFKRFTNRKCGINLWQRSYYEHVIRDEQDYSEIWNYIDNNPAKWSLDQYFTDSKLNN